MRFLLLLLGVPVLAHTLYFLPSRFRVKTGESLLVSIHNGDAFPASEDAVHPTRIAEARLISATKATGISGFRTLGRATHASITLDEPGSQWLAVSTKPNLITLPAAKFASYLGEEGLESIDEWRRRNGESGKPGRERYTKHAKSLIVAGDPGAGWDKTLGLDIEFVLGADPARLKPGDSLPVRVLWHGKPAAGLRVERAWASPGGNGSAIVGRTGNDGAISVPVDRAGQWRLHTLGMERAKGDPDADWRSYWCTVTFEVM